MWNFKRILLGLLLVGQVQANSVIDPNNYQALASDNRSFRVGDPLVILVLESTSAKSSAGTGTTQGVGLGLSASDSNDEVSVGLGLKGNSDGNGQTVREGVATTTLSAIITEVLPNGLIRIKGEHNMLINDENQKVLISGIARVVDIDKGNTLISNRIANAEIEIHGKGKVNDAQKSGMITRFLRWLGLV